MNRTRLLALLTTLILLAVSLGAIRSADAQTYPSRSVKLVVPYPPGGPTDVIARILAQKLAEALGAPFYVENLPGAGGSIGAGAVGSAAPDGNTILIANQDLVVQPIVKSKVHYDPFKSFAPVTLMVTAPEMIVVNPSLPAKSVGELIALLKANPGRFSYASPGYGTTPHLACEWLFKLTYGLEITHVPFQGSAPAIQSLLAGDTPIFHNVLPAVAPLVREGKLRPLAVAASKRSPYFPDVPTIAEAGAPGHEVGFWMAVLLPAGTPAQVIELIQRQTAAALARPEVKARLNDMGFDPTESTPDGLSAHMKAETAKWAKVVRDAGIRID
jgi:tripartite-type tricarboxylate transporter receptor subunit TctC